MAQASCLTGYGGVEGHAKGWKGGMDRGGGGTRVGGEIT